MKQILVTGAAGGMGQALCRRLAEHGWNIWGLDRREADLPGVRFLLCDLTDPASVNAAYDTVREQAGHLDAIVHTAGIYDLDSLLELDEARFRRIFDINLFGVYRINKAFVPLLSEGGRIVITTSELAPLDPLPFTGIYGITKSALEKYAYSLRMEVTLLGLQVSVIRPGAVKTGLLGDSTRALDHFCGHTRLYSCNAARFKRIVDSVEARSISPQRIADTIEKALTARRPRFVYNLNRNPLLRLLNLLPHRLQVFVIRKILK